MHSHREIERLFVVAWLTIAACGGPDSAGPGPAPDGGEPIDGGESPDSGEPIDAGDSPDAAPQVTALPWVRFDGERFRLEDGRELVARGLDYAYNTIGYSDIVFDLVEDDFARMAAWGANVLRVRLRDTRSGWYPWDAPEPGYLEGLDWIVERANAQGIYVIIATDGAEQMLGLDDRPEDPLYEQARFIPGTRAHEHWLDYMDGMFARYRDASGVVGFDVLNEDYAFPPESHDSEYMRQAHEWLLERLRASDSRHVYFQEPAGWSYRTAFSVAVGHPLVDENRVFCTKWFAMQDPVDRMAEMVAWAEEAGTPLFLCEAWVWDIRSTRTGQPVDAGTVRAAQRVALELIDQSVVGFVTNGYVPGIGLIQLDRDPIHLTDEWIRPYPVIVGGERTATSYDFETRRLVVDLELDGSGETELFVPFAHTYPEGFRACTGAGAVVTVAKGGEVTTEGTGLAWDANTQRVRLAAGSGSVQVIVESTDAAPGPVPQSSERADYDMGELPEPGTITRPIYSLAEGEATLRDRMLSSGDFSAAQVDCIIERWQATLDATGWEIVARAALMTLEELEPFDQGVYGCL